MVNDDGTFLHSFHEELGSDPVDQFKGNPIKSTGQRRGGDEKEAFRRIRVEVLTNLLTNLRRRFPRVDLIDAMQIFDAAAYPDPAHLNQWGVAFLDTLLKHYGSVISNYQAVIDSNFARQEFLLFKRVVAQNMLEGEKKLRPIELFNRIFGVAGNRELFPEMYKLMSLSLVVMVGNAEAERAFSVQNRIKTNARVKLSIEHLDRLIRVRYADIPIEDFCFVRAAERYITAVRRR